MIDLNHRKTAASEDIAIDRVKGEDLSALPIEKSHLRGIWYFIAITSLYPISYGWAIDSVIVGIMFGNSCGALLTLVSASSSTIAPAIRL